MRFFNWICLSIWVMGLTVFAVIGMIQFSRWIEIDEFWLFAGFVMVIAIWKWSYDRLSI